MQICDWGRGFESILLLWTLASCQSELVAQALPATVLSIGEGENVSMRQSGRPVTVRLA